MPPSGGVVVSTRLLFVTCSTTGGSGRSQRELAARLERSGHVVRFLADDAAPSRVTRFAYEQLSDIAARTDRLPGGQITEWLERRPGRRTRSVEIDGRMHSASPVPQNALSHEITDFAPDVVVANSLDRLAWRRVHRICRQHRVPVILYVRETDSLRHFEHGEVPDLLIANAESLQTALRGLGLTCEFVPSVVDVSTTTTDSTRDVALAINPVATRGVDVVWRIIEAAPEIDFVVQESWPMTPPEVAEVQQHVSRLPNVEFRRSAPPGPHLYGDARVLLVPYRVDNRPRVIPEAQSNGIPVLAADVPALCEAIGDGGSVVPIDDIGAWVWQLRSLWSDQARYDQLADAALAHSRRIEIDPVAVAREFERLVANLLA
jgi:glycosyltransferase involved in cell wall biosynthesis